LAQASSPTYDINDVESLLKETGDASGSDSHGGILVNRATQGLYPPGSTFKLVTLTGALSRGGIRLSDNFNAPGTLEIGGATVTNFQNTSYGEITVKRALEVSSNTVFAQIANLLGPQTLLQTANEFGFGQKLGQDFDTSASLMPDPDDMTEWETAWAGAGEPVGEHRGSPAGPQATVTQMALVAAAFANDGVIMKPYVVASTVSPDGKTLTRATPIPLNTIASADVVAQVNEAMAGVVSEGFGYEAQIPGYTVYGKTGTAETNNEMADSWFIGHLEVSGRRIAIALALEQSGGGVATPRAREVLEEAISVYR
ncbi:MAG: peptidoglycan glycosyltransferase, partial [Coriobacteriales bacterium]|nr:peptidoglycan glycosyltransferase [Coriobacteriales bacterium]